MAYRPHPAAVSASEARQRHEPDEAGVALEPTVTLTLSRRDARVLRALCGWVEGDPEGPRGAFKGIAEQLDRQGVVQSLQIFREVKVECVAAWPAGERP